ncbi:hypothetical protein J0H33_10680 [bacterium]|nr:hypothetical protein [bacterium]
MAKAEPHGGLMLNRIRWMRIGISLALLGGLCAATGIALYAGSDSRAGTLATRTRLPSPLYGLSAQERFDTVQKLDAQEAATQQAFREQFAAAGRAIGSLPTAVMTGSVLTASDLTELAGRSQAVVVGMVVDQAMADDYGSVVSSLRVDRVLAGALAGASVDIRQPGAPTRIGDDEVLLQSPGNPVLRGATHYVLFLGTCMNPEWVGYACLGTLGDQFTVTDGRLTLQVGAGGETEDQYWAFALDGVTVDELAAHLAAANHSGG